MKKFRSILCCVLSMAVILVLLAGCGGSGGQGSSGSSGAQNGSGSGEAQAQQSAEGSEEEEKDRSGQIGLDDSNLGQAKLRIVLVTSPKGLQDPVAIGCYKGIQTFLADNPDSSLANYSTETEDTDICAAEVSQIASKYDVVVCCGKLFRRVGTVARKYPRVKFLLIDCPLTEDGTDTAAAAGDAGDAPLLDNVYAVKYNEAEQGFLAGVTAAMETKTGKVAVGADPPDASGLNSGYKNGFFAGVKYANEKLGTKAEAISSNGIKAGEALFDQGVDIVFAASPDNSAETIRDARTRENVYVIGCDTDRSGEGTAQSRNVVLTSIVKFSDRTVMQRLTDIGMDNFEPGNGTVGISTGSVGFVTDQEQSSMSEATAAALQDTAAKLRSGEIAAE